MKRPPKQMRMGYDVSLAIALETDKFTLFGGDGFGGGWEVSVPETADRVLGSSLAEHMDEETREKAMKELRPRLEILIRGLSEENMRLIERIAKALLIQQIDQGLDFRRRFLGREPGTAPDAE